MATIDVKDAAGSTVALEKPLTPGRAAAASSRPVTLSTEDKAVLDTVATAANQTTGNTSLSTIATNTTGVATAANQSTTNTTLSTINSKLTQRAGSSAAVIGDSALVVVNRPDSLADPFAQYEFVAASATTQTLGATGAVGDYLAGVLIYPATAAAGAVSIKDGANTAITVFVGGGTTALPTLAPIPVPLGIYSVSGAWQITTGANVSAMGIGKFT